MNTNTYTKLNTQGMKDVVEAMAALPRDYALHNEAIHSIRYNDEGQLVLIRFAAISMHRVLIPTLSAVGWVVGNSDTIHIQYQA